MPVINGKTVTANQSAVYGVLEELGPLSDLALVPLAQHMLGVHQSSSGIRSRRAELTDMGLVVEVAKTKTPSGRTAGVYGVAA
jgi:hypothetical protein